MCGILGNGYPHENLSVLKLNTKEEAYYATKTALWTYLLGDWSINGLAINPALSGADREAAQRVLNATKWIYSRGMTWTQLETPKLTATPDKDKAYPATINGQACYQQVFTVESGTWSVETVKVQLATNAPAGAVIMDMDDKETDHVLLSTRKPYRGQFKVVYPASSVVNANLKLSIFAETKCHFSAVGIVVYTALFHNFTCRHEACQALIYQPVLGLTGENGKYNYSKAVHVYPPFSDITCSAKNYKIALALTNIKLMFSFMLTYENTPLRLCRECAKPFIAPRSNSYFCSPACREKHKNKRK